jgi:hypothetical protein
MTFEDLAGVQTALAQRLSQASDLHQDEIRNYAETTFANTVGPFCLVELAHPDEQWSCLIHGNGIDLFRLADVREQLTAIVERRSLAPLYGAQCVEEIKVFPPSRGWRAQIRVTHRSLEGEIVLDDSGDDPDNRARIRAVFELLRTWARAPVATFVD